MTRPTNPTNTIEAERQAAFNEGYRSTIDKLLAVAALPGVTPAMAVAFVERGLDVEAVRRLAPEAIMQRALKLQ